MQNSLFSGGHTIASEHPALIHERAIDVLRLIRSENVGPVTFFRLLSVFGSARKALDALPDMARRGGKRAIRVASEASAVEELEKAEAFGARMIMYGQPDYPALLTTLHDAPPVIFVRGYPSVWQRELVIGVVGARNASANGCRFAQMMATELGKHTICVVSGLARGIDSAAHQGAIASGTVGVIAGGINTIYPAENKALYERMAAEGAIIAIQPWGVEPVASSFPARNRIISGMSHGLLVVEASLKSGSLITARQALEQNREIFAVPGSPMDPRCKGTNLLLREGATLTENAQDILQQLEQYRSAPLSEPPMRAYQPSGFTVPDEASLNNARTALIQKLGHEAVLVDELVAQCQLTADVAITALLELELAERIHRHPGNRVSLAVF